MIVSKPYSESCDQNKQVILDVIQPILKNSTRLLEIGSGTGQHAVFFAQHMAHLHWQCSDRVEYHQGIQMYVDEAKLANLSAPLALDVSQTNWPELQMDAVFSANTFHIMHWQNVVDFFARLDEVLSAQGQLLIYGPFNYNQSYTSQSNAQFDQWLKSRDPQSGIRDFEAVEELAVRAGLRLQSDVAMPANNRILHWQRD